MNIVVENNKTRKYYAVLKSNKPTKYCIARICYYKFCDVTQVFVERSQMCSCFNNIFLDDNLRIKTTGIIDKDTIHIVDNKYGKLDILYICDYNKGIIKNNIMNEIVEEIL